MRRMAEWIHIRSKSSGHFATVRENVAADALTLSNMLRRFPTLEMLDKEPVTKIAFDGPSTSKPHTSGPHPIATTFPSQMMPAFVVGVDGALVSSFFSRFVRSPNPLQFVS